MYPYNIKDIYACKNTVITFKGLKIAEKHP